MAIACSGLVGGNSVRGFSLQGFKAMALRFRSLLSGACATFLLCRSCFILSSSTRWHSGGLYVFIMGVQAQACYVRLGLGPKWRMSSDDRVCVAATSWSVCRPGLCWGSVFATKRMVLDGGCLLSLAASLKLLLLLLFWVLDLPLPLSLNGEKHSLDFRPDMAGMRTPLAGGCCMFQARPMQVS